MKPRIAIVDDDQNILTSVSIAFEADGLETRTYPDGERALAGMRDDPVDLAVLDIKMPRMDGLELLTRLRRDSSMPVIFLTSKDDEVDELLGLKMGADDYITKPFSVRLLIERVRALLRRVDLSARTPTTVTRPRRWRSVAATWCSIPLVICAPGKDKR